MRNAQKPVDEAAERLGRRQSYKPWPTPTQKALLVPVKRSSSVHAILCAIRVMSHCHVLARPKRCCGWAAQRYKQGTTTTTTTTTIAGTPRGALTIAPAITVHIHKPRQKSLAIRHRPSSVLAITQTTIDTCYYSVRAKPEDEESRSTGTRDNIQRN